MIKYSKKPDSFKRIAQERITELFVQASLTTRQDLADRYVYLAKKIAMKYKTRFIPEYRRRFCRKCGSFFRFGENCRVRTNEGKIVYYCLRCKTFQRFPISRSVVVVTKKSDASTSKSSSTSKNM